jgi:hypothetical protein
MFIEAISDSNIVGSSYKELSLSHGLPSYFPLLRMWLLQRLMIHSIINGRRLETAGEPNASSGTSTNSGKLAEVCFRPPAKHVRPSPLQASLLWQLRVYLLLLG